MENTLTTTQKVNDASSVNKLFHSDGLTRAADLLWICALSIIMLPIGNSAVMAKSQDGVLFTPIPELDYFPPVAENLSKRYLTREGSGKKNPVRTIGGKQYQYLSSEYLSLSDVNGSDLAKEGFSPHAFDSFVTLVASEEDFYANDDGVWLLVIDTVRVNGTPYFHYFGNFNRMTIPYEPWSSAKFLSSAALLSKLGSSLKGRNLSDASIGKYHIGDLFSQAFSYQHSSNVMTTSNQVSNFILRSATEEYADGLIKNWLGIRDGSGFFGKFGIPVFDPGTNVWRVGKEKVRLPYDFFSGLDAKAMSLLTVGEWLRRLAFHGTKGNFDQPYTTYQDLQTLFYGNEKTSDIGGALKGTGLFVSRVLAGEGGGYGGEKENRDNINQMLSRKITERFGSGWRIFHKNGGGPSTARERSEVTYVAFVTLPNFQDGREFVIVARSSYKVEGCSTPEGDCRARIHEASNALRDSAERVIKLLLGL